MDNLHPKGAGDNYFLLASLNADSRLNFNERSRQLIENKDDHFLTMLESRQLAENIEFECVKAVNVLKNKAVVMFSGEIERAGVIRRAGHVVRSGLAAG